MRRRSRLLNAVPLALLALVLLASSAAGWSGQRYPIQSVGDRGTDVRTIQFLLRHHGYPAPATGAFDAATVEQVKAFEAANGLTVDGLVATADWQLLAPRLAKGDAGYAVRALQRQLNEKRAAKLVENGVFDESTHTALVAFQRHASVGRLGVAGTGTWQALLWHFELPRFSASGLCDYSVGNGMANWGTASTIAQVEAAGARMVGLGHGRVAVGDISHEHGGDIAGHVSHEVGLDVDLRLMRHARDQCQWGGTWKMSYYDRAATRDLVKAIRATAPGHVKLIYFNDPVLIREGLTRWYAGHEDHLHVRYCQAAHPIPAYRC